MEKNPKKSKALIITFVIVLALLIGGYFLFTKTNILTKNGIVGKVFAPLLGTSKQKDLATIQETETTPTGTTPGGTTPGGTTPGGTTPGGTTPGGTGPATPGTNPFPTPSYATCYDGIKNQNETRVDTGGVCTGWSGRGTCFDGIKNQNETRVDTGGVCSSGGSTPTKTQCNDGIDNDGDTFIDSADAGCHTDFDKTNTSSFNINLNDESLDGTNPGKKPIPIQCPSLDPVFNDVEKAQLADLTRQYYHIAATLHTQEDILSEQSAKKSYDDLVYKINDPKTGLITQCYADQKYPYSGPTARRKNPYYNSKAQTDYFSYFYRGENNNSGIDEPILQSLMNMTNIVKKYSNRTDQNIPTDSLKTLVDNVLGPRYEEGAELPKRLPCTLGTTNSKTQTYCNYQIPTVGSSRPGADNLLNSAFLSFYDYSTDATVDRETAKALYDTFTYGRKVHTHSCEGLFDYSGTATLANGGDNVLANVKDSLKLLNLSLKPTPVTECNDGIDNDGDGKIDSNDKSCYRFNSNHGYVYNYGLGQYDPTWNSESTDINKQAINPQCGDEIDNDGDGLIDSNDPECHISGAYNANLNDESSMKSFEEYARMANDVFGFSQKDFTSGSTGEASTNYNITTANMTPEEKKACNDIYGLRLILDKTSNEKVLKDYMNKIVIAGCGDINCKAGTFTNLIQTLSEKSTSPYLGDIYRGARIEKSGSGVVTYPLYQGDLVDVVYDSNNNIIPVTRYTVKFIGSIGKYINLGLFPDYYGASHTFSIDYFDEIERMFNIW